MTRDPRHQALPSGTVPGTSGLYRSRSAGRPPGAVAGPAVMRRADRRPVSRSAGRSANVIAGPRRLPDPVVGESGTTHEQMGESSIPPPLRRRPGMAEPGPLRPGRVPGWTPKRERAPGPPGPAARGPTAPAAHCGGGAPPVPTPLHAHSRRRLIFCDRNHGPSALISPYARGIRQFSARS